MVNAVNDSNLRRNPIVEASVNIRCTFSVPTDAVFGIVYQSMKQLKLNTLQVHQLPIASIPEQIRKSDPNLTDKPTHQIVCERGIVAIGTNIISIGLIPPYISWDNFDSFIDLILNNIYQEVIKGVTNISIRYLNFFKSNIFDHINLKIIFGQNKLSGPNTTFRTELPINDKFKEILQITNCIHLKNQTLHLDSNGSLIDITVFSTNVDSDFNQIKEDIGGLHDAIETSFFKLVSQDIKNHILKGIAYEY